MIFRTCKNCKLEACTEKDLELFVTNKDSKYGKRNQCLKCRLKYDEERYTINKESMSIRAKEYYSENKEQIKKRVNLYYTTTKHKEYRVTNKEKMVAYQKEYSSSIRGKALGNARNAKRRAIKLNATPIWLTEEHKQQIKDIYKLTTILNEATELDWHVDHIYPLQNEDSCGLHVPWNLRVIPAVLNLQKGNKLPI